MKFRLALIQMRIIGGRKDENLSHARTLIAEASRHGADVALLPETMDLGWTDPSSLSQAEPLPDGMPCRVLAEAAKKHGLLVCAGLTEREGSAVFNSAVLLGSSGELLCRHRKLNELDIGHPYYAQGDRLNVAQTGVGAIGLMICADGFAHGHVLSRALGYMGADVILSPCAWAVEHDHDNSKTPYGDTWREAYKPVARDFAVWIAGVSNVGHIQAGPWAGRKCIGCSLVIGPDGDAVVQGPYGVDAEAILYVDVETRERPARGALWSGRL
jgi:predicted amidohydrolase